MKVEKNRKGMNSRVERINPYLMVQDIPTSTRFYVDVLGFDQYLKLPDFGIVERDGHQIHLISEPGKGNTPHRVWIGVEDIAVLFDQFRKNAAEFQQEPRNFTWAYQMIVQDPDGHLLIFGSGPKQDEPFLDQVEPLEKLA